MAGMRRRLRGITTRVTGSTPPERDEAEPAPPAPEPAPAELPGEAEAVISETGEVPVVADPELIPSETEPAAEPAAQLVAEVDAVLAAAVDLAREVAREASEGSVGDYLGVESEGNLVATHLLATTDKAYVGWRWAVTVARAEGTEDVTVDEVVLLPGADALLAPAWVPWSERVQPGDLAPGDLLPPAKDDPRLVPAYTDTEADLAAETFWELGLGRTSVLSLDARLDAADRWYDGDQGPHSSMAKQAPGHCFDCGFRLSLAGGLKAAFGVCANALAPDDGRVVAMEHGCGAHSETPVDQSSVLTGALVVEDEELELVAVGTSLPTAAVAEPSPEDETPDGHAS